MDNFSETLSQLEQLVNQLIDSDGANFKQLAALAGLNILRDLQGANLAGVDLRGLNLSSADLRWTILDEADLRGVRLIEADLTGASLRGANLEGAILDRAILKNADLREANLRLVSLDEADLEGALLEEVSWERKLSPAISNMIRAMRISEEKREKVLKDMWHILQNQDEHTEIRRAAAIVLGGIGGIGKSQFLLEAIRFLGEQYEPTVMYRVFVNGFESLSNWEKEREKKTLQILKQSLRGWFESAEESRTTAIIILDGLNDIERNQLLQRSYQNLVEHQEEISSFINTHQLAEIFESLSNREKKYTEKACRVLWQTLQDRSESMAVRQAAAEALATLLSSSREAAWNISLGYWMSPHVQWIVLNIGDRLLRSSEKTISDLFSYLQEESSDEINERVFEVLDNPDHSDGHSLSSYEDM